MALTGLDAILYHNTGSFGSPVWDAVTNCRDATLNIEVGEADASRRGAVWSQRVPTLIDATLDFSMVWEEADADFTVFRTAALARTTVEVLALDGAHGESLKSGLRAICYVFTLNRNEPLTEALTVDVSLRPGFTTLAEIPTWDIRS